MGMSPSPLQDRFFNSSNLQGKDLEEAETPKVVVRIKGMVR